MARKRYTADDVLGYIRRYRAVHASSPTRAQIGRGLNIHLATAAHHVQRLIDRGDAEAVGPLRTIKLRDENLPIVKLGPIRPDESVTDPARSTGTVTGLFSKSPRALCSYQCRCKRHSLPGSSNW